MGKPVNGEKRDISIKRTIISVFLAAMLVSLLGIGYLIFANWYASAEKTADVIADNIGDELYHGIDDFLQLPRQINEGNLTIIKRGLIDLGNDENRDKYFLGVLKSANPAIYSFTYGSESGEYYGARRNTSGELEIVRNNAATEGSSWYYRVNGDTAEGEPVFRTGSFDPRQRAWYREAVKRGGPVLSPIYKHFLMNDLAVSAAQPVYDDEGRLIGVMGTHILLSGFEAFLKSTVEDYQGHAFIVEKDGGALIANSEGIGNFTIAPDGTLKRLKLSEVTLPGVKEAYAKYAAEHNSNFSYEFEGRKLHVSIREIHMDGIDWVIVSAIPDGPLMAYMKQSIQSTVLLALLALVLFAVIYQVLTGRLMAPIDNLLQTAGALASGDLSKRASVVRNDEIGSIAASVNKVADKMQFLINDLEEAVKVRTEELRLTNESLAENRNQLQLILDSTAEAIYGMDLEGRCTFCNRSCLRLLGYKNQSELLGKNMHDKIHHSRVNGEPMPLGECRIYRALTQGAGFEADDEIFWRADGTSFAVGYHAYPQFKSGKVVGGVVTFMDITDRKQKEKEIEYLSCHDTLTGVYNRRCLEESAARIDKAENLPLSVIFADVNGLKITNDVFGHAAGDELIKGVALLLSRCCRQNDVIGRVGGDEFVLLLPRTTAENAWKVIERIKVVFAAEPFGGIKGSISLGLDTKTHEEQTLDEILANAESSMYDDKSKNRKAVNNGMLDTIVELLHAKSGREKEHAANVSRMCGELGAALELSEAELSRLQRAAYLHDIGKVMVDDELLEGTLTDEDKERMQQHSVYGYRILSLFDDTLDLAEYVYSHHERWDGTGYPRGLKGEAIPLLSRIILVVETYERTLNKGSVPTEASRAEALSVVREGSGSKFDPQIAELFLQLLLEKKPGA